MFDRVLKTFHLFNILTFQPVLQEQDLNIITKKGKMVPSNLTLYHYFLRNTLRKKFQELQKITEINPIQRRI